ncbi:MAG: lactate utilization protein [Candidatus Omnitrophica bacterium]|nr:lactate utilization protein [Candidatus Omnitrophota bacterium]
MTNNKIYRLIRSWLKRNIEGIYCQDEEEATEKLLSLIPKDSSVGLSGSLTLNELGIVKLLESRGNLVFNQNRSGIGQKESFNLRRQGVSADYYLASPNAISEKGEMVFFSAYGNRIAGIAYAKNVIIVCGINKITSNLQEAIKRAREYVTPLNCRRLNWNTPCLKDGICRDEICLFPEYKRMCCQILIVEAEAISGRLKVLLIDESLGF